MGLVPEDIGVKGNVDININVPDTEQLQELGDSLTENAVIFVVALTGCSIIRNIVLAAVGRRPTT